MCGMMVVSATRSANPGEPGNVTEETGAKVLQTAPRVPSESGGWQAAGLRPHIVCVGLSAPQGIGHTGEPSVIIRRARGDASSILAGRLG